MLASFKVTDEKSRIRIRIRTKMSRIPNTEKTVKKEEHTRKY